jgi:hypothetical protein
MRIGTRLRAAALALTLASALALGGCAGPADAFSGIKFASGKMLHLQQVLEHYDANGSPVPQYLELWLVKGRARCEELDNSGNILNVALDTGKSHITFNVSSHEAQKQDKSGVFAVSLAGMKKAYPKVSKQNDGTYAGRACDFYLLGDGNTDEWVKLYVDKATGCVLLCDAPLFRLRTALLEELPVDGSLFSEPHNLVYKGGDGN